LNRGTQGRSPSVEASHRQPAPTVVGGLRTEQRRGVDLTATTGGQLAARTRRVATASLAQPARVDRRKVGGRDPRAASEKLPQRVTHFVRFAYQERGRLSSQPWSGRKDAALHPRFSPPSADM
jgi:hypothetical protein